MSSKYKATGCARFFLVLIVLAPLAYLGASYYNGEDGIENVKNLLGIESSQSHEEPTNNEEKSAPTESSENKGPQGEKSNKDESLDTNEEQAQPAHNNEEQTNQLKEEIEELKNENKKLHKENEDILRRLDALEQTPADTTG